MKIPVHSSRRGAALLLVLATLVLTTVSCTIAAQRAATLAMTRRADHASRVADDLMLAVDAPIQHWLATTPPTAVLPPEAAEPRVDVLDDVFALGEFDARITITAFDQLGMVPWQLLHTPSPLMSVLPAEVEQLIEHPASTDKAPWGLDMVALGAPTVDWQVYPAARSEDTSRSAIGALVATHNTSGGINVNTAPRTLLEVAMREAGRGGIEAILESRSNGKAATFAARSSRSSQQSVSLTAMSDVWAFRIDIRVGPITRSWWCVYAPGSSRHSSRGSFNCVQRLVIPE
jgi:hypothetical protein